MGSDVGFDFYVVDMSCCREAGEWWRQTSREAAETGWLAAFALRMGAGEWRSTTEFTCIVYDKITNILPPGFSIRTSWLHIFEEVEVTQDTERDLTTRCPMSMFYE